MMEEALQRTDRTTPATAANNAEALRALFPAAEEEDEELLSAQLASWRAAS
jgi:hypothetical protein